MKVVSVNLGVKKSVNWRGKEVETGIFKYPTNSSIRLGKEDVEDDQVIERKYHGGIDKACYIYSADHYPYWEQLYPELNFQPGMFGENITIEGLDETQIFIGDIFQIGEAKVEVSQPREPCYKLGFRFNTQKVLKQFLNTLYSGIYLRVIEEGEVKVGDKLELIEKGYDYANLAECYRLAFHSKPEETDAIRRILSIEGLPSGFAKTLSKRIK
jgi:MOSC domain-containing protein YiiM